MCVTEMESVTVNGRSGPAPVEIFEFLHSFLKTKSHNCRIFSHGQKKVKFSISFLHYLVRCFKKDKIYHKMQHEKKYNIQRTNYSLVALLVVKMNKVLKH